MFFVKIYTKQVFLINKLGLINYFFNRLKLIVLKFVPNIFFLLLFFPVSIILRVISPFFLIRFKPLTSDRIGHFALQSELYLCEKKLKRNSPKQKYIDFFFNNTHQESCNKYFEKLVKKKINIIPYGIGKAFYYLNRLFCFILKKKNIF